MHQGRIRTVIVVVVALLGATLPAPASAADELPPTLSSNPLPTWQTNGAVWALEHINGVLYVGGAFTAVRPPGTAEGSPQEIARQNFAAFDAQTGALLPCAPSFTWSGGTPSIRALKASADGSRLYVGGRFSNVSGTGVANLVALDTASCLLVPWAQFRRPNVSSTVRAISVTATNVYFGGDFKSVDSQTRNRYAVLGTDGTLLASSTSFNKPVRAILAAPDHGRVLVGGIFDSVNGSAIRGLVALHPSSSTVVQTFPGWIPTNSAVQALIRDDDGHFFVAAEGSGYGVFDGRIAGYLATGAMKWKDYCLGANQALAVHQGVLYSGHHAHECQTTPGGWLEDGFRQHLLAQSIETKEIIPTFFADTNDGIGAAPQGPRALVMAGEILWVGGEFTTVNGAGQRGLARFGSNDPATVFPPNLVVTSMQSGTNLVSWIAAYSRDHDELTYELSRDGTVIDTQTVRSRWWMRRTMSFVDNSATPGQPASYRIRVREPGGDYLGPISAAFNTVTRAQDEQYAGAVLADDPSLYWRLDETAEQDARTRNGQLYYRARIWDFSGNAVQGTAERGYNLSGGFTLGGPSALEDGSGRSMTLLGTNGRVTESFANDDRPARQAPSEYSIEFWFQSTSSSGGRIAGFGNRRTDMYERTPPGSEPPVFIPYTSTTHDRHVYMTNTGNLIFGKRSGSSFVTAKSPQSYNNGQWHHVVATSGPSGMRLFVNGAQVASNANTGSLSYDGFWRVGTDTLSGWPERPTNNGIDGSVDEFAVYDYQLSSSRVVAHYAAGRPSAGIDTQPPTVPQDVSASVSGDSVHVSWSASTDNVGVTGYDVHRGGSLGFTPAEENRVATVAGTSFTDVGVPAGTWSYRVVARDAQGNLSQPSSATTVTVEAQSVVETVTVTASADTYVHQWLATTNFGTGHNMTVKGVDPYQAVYMRFGLPSGPDGSVLVDATLRIRTTLNDFAGSVDPLVAQLADDNWSETTMTYNTRAAIPGPDLGVIPGGTVIGTTYDIPLDAVALRPLVGGNASLAITMSGSDGWQINTREAAGEKPQLILEYGSS